jgi:uncharacterized membrane protein YciS (DUF1049 family)
MTAGIIMLIALVIAVFYIKNKIDTIANNVEKQIERIKEQPGDVAMDIGSAVAASAIKKVKKLMTR